MAKGCSSLFEGIPLQIVGINIGPAAAPSGPPLVRVVFEGGESVAVEMARGEDADGALGAIDRAKALLVQTAAFEMRVNGDDMSSAESDDVHSGESRVYTFEYRDGEQARQVNPAEMPSFEAARAEAIRCAIDIASRSEARR
ncbi:hypothetical protein FJV76_13395 [Mesorhizobium sp. WSM4303]|uniref:hypothetical protein n=1 Tax=unclassified Mesorhizobium TaxID=325217 RepID=UPI00115E8B06|nr:MULTISPECIES: hypothetical protein [unclassified Mesorhizobium]TRC98311.1 hypothetical protein FJV77_07505 [Mesorhizobium sp. WSM4306]TRD04287.1 hypothetical protein FJV76_13395 [Mesorhizobium sp. WSM4303]